MYILISMFFAWLYTNNDINEHISEYAQVIKMLGNGRLEAFCFDGTRRLCHIRGKLRKKVRLFNELKWHRCYVIIILSSTWDIILDKDLK